MHYFTIFKCIKGIRQRAFLSYFIKKQTKYIKYYTLYILCSYIIISKGQRYKSTHKKLKILIKMIVQCNFI